MYIIVRLKIGFFFSFWRRLNCGFYPGGWCQHLVNAFSDARLVSFLISVHILLIRNAYEYGTLLSKDGECTDLRCKWFKAVFWCRKMRFFKRISEIKLSWWMFLKFSMKNSSSFLAPLQVKNEFCVISVTMLSLMLSSKVEGPSPHLSTKSPMFLSPPLDIRTTNPALLT